MKIIKRILITILAVLLVFVGYIHLNWHSFDKEKAARYIRSHALSRSHTCCAWFVMKAMWAGGKPVYILRATDYQYILPSLGFKEIDADNYSHPQVGDIAVHPAVYKHTHKGFLGMNHPFGHIHMWDGRQWVSDFREKNFFVCRSGCWNNEKFRIFRYEE